MPAFQRGGMSQDDRRRRAIQGGPTAILQQQKQEELEKWRRLYLDTTIKWVYQTTYLLWKKASGGERSSIKVVLGEFEKLLFLLGYNPWLVVWRSSADRGEIESKPDKDLQVWILREKKRLALTTTTN